MLYFFTDKELYFLCHNKNTPSGFSHSPVYNMNLPFENGESEIFDILKELASQDLILVEGSDYTLSPKALHITNMLLFPDYKLTILLKSRISNGCLYVCKHEGQWFLLVYIPNKNSYVLLTPFDRTGIYSWLENLCETKTPDDLSTFEVNLTAEQYVLLLLSRIFYRQNKNNSDFDINQLLEPYYVGELYSLFTAFDKSGKLTNAADSMFSSESILIKTFEGLISNKIFAPLRNRYSYTENMIKYFLSDNVVDFMTIIREGEKPVTVSYFIRNDGFLKITVSDDIVNCKSTFFIDWENFII